MDLNINLDAKSDRNDVDTIKTIEADEMNP